MILRLENVYKNYYIDKIKIKVMKNISYEFNSGNIYAVIGKKFAGKTLFINLIGTIELPTSGYLTIDNVSYIKKKDKDISYIRNKYFGYILPYLDLDKDLSIIENILLPTSKKDKEKAIKLLEYVGINNKRKLDINNLSEYDRLRILLARALINDPKIILIDDEIDKLNSNNQKEFIKLLKQIAKDKIIILTTKSKTVIDNSDNVLELKCGSL